MKKDRILTVMVALQIVTLCSLWLGQSLPAAHAADLPDPGLQREKQLEELRKLNDKMDKLLEVLASGKLQVRVPRAEEK